jgi:hypothetical protein
LRRERGKKGTFPSLFSSFLTIIFPLIVVALSRRRGCRLSL